MIWKLLRKNISIWQIAGYAAATFIGLSIVLIALQFYRDVSADCITTTTMPASLALYPSAT